MFVLPFLITVELLPTEKKTFISMMINFPFVIGETLMCVIAWATTDYTLMHLAGYLPLLLLFPLWFLIPESPRWLLAKGRIADAKKEIKFGARLTKVKLDSSLCEDVEEDGEDVSILKTSESKTLDQELYREVGFIDILKSRTLLIRLLVCIQ